MKRLFVLAVALTAVSGAAWAQSPQTQTSQPIQQPSMAEMQNCKQYKSEVEQTRCLNGGANLAASPAPASGSSNPSLSQSPSRQPAQQKK